MDELKNILNDDAEKPVDNEKLMQYLQGNLSHEEMHAVEKQMADSAFMQDAMEGLEQMHSATALNQYVHELNNNLQKQLQERKNKKEKRKIQHLGWIITTVVILLLLVLLGFAVLQSLKNN
jgi:CHASE3 domain sensor protein